MGKLVSIQWPNRVNQWLLRRFIAAFSIDTSEAEKDYKDYPSIQEFFIRRLKAGARTLSQKSDEVLCPCDGFLSEGGLIEEGKLLQIKGKIYSLASLLADENLARKFDGGYFCTLYLSPKDYHRFHVPCDGNITETRAIAGTLWPVNNWAVEHITDLFCNNERIITLIEKQHQKKSIAYISVGATMVGKIKLNYCSLESNKEHRQIIVKHDEQIPVHKGQELGRFMFGSTVILLFEKDMVREILMPLKSPVKMGEALARFKQ